MNDNVEIIRSNKGGMKIIHRGYMYTVHKKRQGGGIRWRCTQRSLHCKGSISTGNGPPSVNMPHNHIPDPHSVALARCRQLEEFPDINSLLETECEEVKEQQSNREAEKKYGISETNIRRWRRLKTELFDTMPLQQRMQLSSPPQLQIPSTSDSVLQSQPLSPTKLKVTRHTSKQLNSKASGSIAEEVCLRWNSHHSNMQATFPQLLEKEQYVDVTIIAEDKTLKCHRMILSSCSAYFEEILNGITPLQHPVIILKGIPFWILKALIDFMYVGEINIDQGRLPELLDVAESLKVKGLAGKSNNQDQANKQENQPTKKIAPKENAKSQTVKNVLRQPSPVTKLEEIPINDPLDLLEPKFHEEVEGTSSKTKEVRLSAKKNLTKKFRKRKSSEEEPNIPMFPMRRGTRSRPNVKIPKYYDYEDIIRPSAPDAAQPFPPVVNIKSEPLEIEENDSYNDNNISIDTENSSMEITCINPRSLEKSPVDKDSPICIKGKSLNNDEKTKPTYRIKIKSFSSLTEKTKNKTPIDEEEIDIQKTAATISLVVKPNDDDDDDKEKMEIEEVINSVEENSMSKDPLEITSDDMACEEAHFESQEEDK